MKLSKLLQRLKKVCLMNHNCLGSSISHKKTPWFLEFTIFLLPIVYGSILIKISMNANTEKTQISQKIKYVL